MKDFAFKLIGYNCPIERYPSAATPIILNLDNDQYMAIYLDDNCEMDNEIISSNSKFTKFSDYQKKKLENFSCSKHRLFAISKDDIRFYHYQEKVSFFRKLLDDKNFSYQDPFFRISLAEEIAEESKDQYILIHELSSAENYLCRYKPELMWLLEDEESRLKEIGLLNGWNELSNNLKPHPKNRAILGKQSNQYQEMKNVIFCVNE